MLIRLMICAAMLVTLMGCSFNISVLGGGRAPLHETVVEDDDASENKILLISIEGTISSADTRSLLGGQANHVDEIRRQLRMARDDDGVKAILLRVNTPGGGASASDTILHELNTFKKASKLPIIAFFQDMATSGGYYISMCADEIIAQPTCLTGSIGVIAVFMDVVNLLEDHGVKVHVIRSSESKASLSPFIKKRPEDLKQAKDMVQDFYTIFLDRVSAGRPKLSKAKLKTLADGRVFFAHDAKANGLIDHVGYMQDAIELAKKKAGISDAKLVTYTSQKGDPNRTFYTKAEATTAAVPTALNLNGAPSLSGGPRFLYYWDGN